MHRLARRLKNEAVVSFFDAGFHAELPPILGHANVTPTVRAVVPDADWQQTGNEPFKLVDYHGDRSFADLHRFALKLMPNYVERALTSEAFHAALAADPGLPKVLCFLGIDPALETPPLLRALSATYRGRVAIIFIGQLRFVRGRAHAAQRRHQEHMATAAMKYTALSPTKHLHNFCDTSMTT